MLTADLRSTHDPPADQRGRIASVIAASDPAEAMQAVLVISAVAQAIDVVRVAPLSSARLGRILRS